MSKRGIIVIVLCLVFWEYSSQNYKIIRLFISQPTLTAKYMYNHYDLLLMSTSITFMEATVGLLLAIILSASLGIVGFYYNHLVKKIMPFLILLQVTPLITLAPFLIMLFGLGVTSKIVMAAILCFFPIYIGIIEGVSQIDENLTGFFTINRANMSDRIRYLYLPLAMPSYMAGLKVAATLAVIGAIVAEFAGAQVGLGKHLYLAGRNLEPELMMSSLLLSSLIGLFLYYLITLVEKKLGRWYQ